MLRRKTRLESRRQDVDRELSAVAHELRQVSKQLRRFGTNYRSGRPTPVGRVVRPLAAQMPWDVVVEKAAGAPPPRIDRTDPGPGAEASSFPGADETSDDGQQKIRKTRDGRFVDYLANNFQADRPLRHERRIQRNKAIGMLVLLALVLFWFVARWLL